jgi:hypothetical protein
VFVGSGSAKDNGEHGVPGGKRGKALQNGLLTQAVWNLRAVLQNKLCRKVLVKLLQRAKTQSLQHILLLGVGV